MNVAVQGCCHGELNLIYKWIQEYEQTHGEKVHLLLCCGDFQAVRHEKDLNDMECPPKYREYRDFREYYNGEKKAPLLTIFVGGNHEAPDFLRSLYYGGWVAPNIYYLGHSGVINVAGLRIAGVSGIFHLDSYTKGYFECRPYDNDTRRSAYHVRIFEVKKLGLVRDKIDVFLSHDWPAGVEQFGDVKYLLNNKPHFKVDVNRNTLGNPANRYLLDLLKPDYWFSGHLHIAYEAMYTHANSDKITYFVAMDKAEPSKNHIKVLPFVLNADCVYDEENHYIDPETIKVCYDREWCAILYANRKKMPLYSFRTRRDMLLDNPDADDFKFVDQRFDNSGYDIYIRDKYKYFVVPYTPDCHKDPDSQRKKFMELLDLPDNNYFTPTVHAMLEVSLLD